MAKKITIPRRSELVAEAEQNYQLRIPGSKVGENTAGGADARLITDVMLPIYSEAARLGQLGSLSEMDVDQLRQEALDHGLPDLLPATGASGEVTISASTGGTTILTGAECKHKVTGNRYACVATKVYADGDPVPIRGIDVGPSTNLSADAQLVWSSPGLGLDPVCTVIADADGGGLTGGRNEESRNEIEERIADARKYPAAAGNDGHYRLQARKTPGVSLQGVFMYPCILGSGTTGMCATLRPGAVGDSRIPNGTQLAAIKSHCVGEFPKDDSLLMCTIEHESVTLVLRARWRRGATGWTDPVPWPVYNASPFTVAASPAPTATVFSVETAMGSPPQPAVGQTIALYDSLEGVWRAKRIASFTGTGPWGITVETTNSSSDITYVPAAGDRVSPWSDLLPSFPEPVRAYFDLLGPGEQRASFFDVGGARERRNPPAEEQYPQSLTGRFLAPLYAIPQVDEVQIAAPSIPATPAVGSPGVSSNMLRLADFAVYPL